MFIEHIIIWVALGFFICYKRNWYVEEGTDDLPPGLICGIAIVAMPLNLAIVFTKIFFINKWEK
jgi:hypothetical protein